MSQPKEAKKELDTREEEIGAELSEVDSLDLKIAENESRLLQYRRRTAALLFALAIVAVLGLSGFFGASLLSKSIPEFTINWRLVGLITAAYAFLLLMASLVGRTVRISSIQQETDNLRAKKQILTKTANTGRSNQQQQPTTTYFDRLVDINVTNLGQYYSLVKYQTNNSFLVSIGVGVFGFALISTGLILGFYNAANVRITYIATAAGLVTEFIASVFFYLYNRTVRQMKEYHDSLLTVQNVLLAFKIVGDTSDEKEKTKMVGQLLGYLVTRQVLPPIVESRTEVKTGPLD